MKRSISAFGNHIVRLRLIADEDLETTLAWRNQDDARIWFRTSEMISLEQHRAWFQRYQARDDDFLFAIEVNGNLVGQASVYAIDWLARSAEVGRFLIVPNERGRGYISQSCHELLSFCAEELGLKYVFLEVMENNANALRVYEHNGFAEESRCGGMIRMGQSLDCK